MAKTTVFTVRGHYGFPFDMLRYDQAWPTSSGVTALSQVTRGENRKFLDEQDQIGKLLPVDVELATRDRVTDDRWHSFGWVVTSKRVVP